MFVAFTVLLYRKPILRSPVLPGYTSPPVVDLKLV